MSIIRTIPTKMLGYIVHNLSKESLTNLAMYLGRYEILLCDGVLVSAASSALVKLVFLTYLSSVSVQIRA